MKISVYLICCLLLFAGCKEKKTGPYQPTVTITPVPDPIRYFPVTNFLKGQLAEIKNNINPLKYSIVGAKMDSAWLKKEDLDKEFAPFFSPLIDTLNMVSLFKEEKFLDESVNSFTYTYTPIGKLPDTVQLQHWDVYVDPQDGKVKRVYMVKKTGDSKEQQLTWQANEKWCRILNITTKPNGTFFVENEQKIIWNF